VISSLIGDHVVVSSLLKFVVVLLELAKFFIGMNLLHFLSHFQC
jgi:hypothetical protein